MSYGSRPDKKCGSIVTDGIIVRNAFPRTSVIDREQADGIGPGFSSQPGTELGIAEAAGEKQIDGSLKKVSILQKERPLLRKENFEPLIYRNLRFVRLDLAEIRIGCDI